MHQKTLACLTLGAGLVLCLGGAEPARAISAFSRQYAAECSTCHTVYPRRNEFGEAFRKNGFVWPGREAPKPEGEEEAYWLSGITRHVPLSVSMFTAVDYDKEREDDKIDPTTDLQLHLGGSFRDQVGFFAHDLTGSAEAFGQVQSVLGTPVNVKVGKIVPQTTLWKPNQAVTNTPLAVHGVSVAGEPSLGTPRDGVELNAILGQRLFLAAGAVDRSGQDRMEYYGHVAYKVGGTTFRGEEPEIDFDEESIWDFLSVTLGAYGYVGHSQIVDNDYYRLGFEAEAIYKGFTLLLGSMAARDDNADGAGLEVDSVFYLAEMDYIPSSNWLLAARYEREDVGNAAAGVVNRGIGAINWTPIQNVLVRLEGEWERASDREDPVDVTGSILAMLHL